MKKNILLLVVLVFSIISLKAQRKELPEFSTRHKNIYGELFGSHILGGVNYDMRIMKGRMDGIGFRAGIGGINIRLQDGSNSYKVGLVTFPLEFNHVLGKRRSSFITGIGILPVYASISGNGTITNNSYVNAKGFAIAGGFMTVGYRLQPLKNGFMMQVNWNPMFLGDGFHAGWLGIGMGVGFK